VYIGDNEMRIGVTINLDHYENVSITSSEHETAAACIDEIKKSEQLFHDPAVGEYLKRTFNV